MRQRALCWFPVVLLPVCNIVSGILEEQSFSISLAWILGAVVEELFFRFFLLKTILLPRIRPVIAIILVSILFASMHLFNLCSGQQLSGTLIQVFCAFCFSIWAGAVTWKVSWMIPLLAHVLMNATAGDESVWLSMIVSGIVLVDGMMLLRNNHHDVE